MDWWVLSLTVKVLVLIINIVNKCSVGIVILSSRLLAIIVDTYDFSTQTSPRILLITKMLPTPSFRALMSRHEWLKSRSSTLMVQ